MPGLNQMRDSIVNSPNLYHILMNNPSGSLTGISSKSAALVGGISLLVMAVIAPIANFGILQGLVVSDNPALTLDNLASNTGPLRTALLLFLIVAVLDIVIAWAMYLYLAPVNQSLSLLAAWFRIVYTAVLLFALLSLIRVVILLGNTELLAGIPDLQTESQVLVSMEVFNLGWEFGLIIFGLHLVLLGILFYKAGIMKKILGILLVIAGAGYVIDGTGQLVTDTYGLTLSMYTFVGELVLFVWLLVRGWKVRPG